MLLYHNEKSRIDVDVIFKSSKSRNKSSKIKNYCYLGEQVLQNVFIIRYQFIKMIPTIHRLINLWTEFSVICKSTFLFVISSFPPANLAEQIITAFWLFYLSRNRKEEINNSYFLRCFIIAFSNFFGKVFSFT